MLNNEAVQALNKTSFEKALQILTFTDGETQPNKHGVFTNLQALTLNNFGCYYRRKNDLKNSYNNLQKALKIINMSYD